MLTKKEIFVLTGAGHKGMVKISPSKNSNQRVVVECNLDFRPSGATLYIVGDEIAQTALNDSKMTCEMPFPSNEVQGCVVRSSSLTMFGGRENKGEILAKIDATYKQKLGEKSSKNTVKFAQKPSAFSTPKRDESNQANTQTNASSNLAKLLSETPNEEGVLKYNGSNFYLAIKPQLDEMFVCYKAEEILNETVENSSWVHIDAEDGFYVVGIIKDGDTPTHICYGVPSYDKNDVPPELKNICVWLPVEYENIKGYWVIYQSAINGEIVK
ncbi:MAG: hypothetical protein J5713_01410 [Clostridia bacterium]|nr:hypothetical protein [Clostridia bacterium]